MAEPSSPLAALRAMVVSGFRRADSWLNVVTGVGGSYDKRVAGEFSASVNLLSPEQCMVLFHQEDLARTLCELVPVTAFRRGFDVTIEDGDELETKISKRLAQLNVRQRAQDAAVFARACGGCLLVLGLEGEQLSDPIAVDKDGNPTNVGKLLWLQVVDRRRCYVSRYDLDVNSPTFGQPEMYRLLPIAQYVTVSPPYSSPGQVPGDPRSSQLYPMQYLEVHASRVVRFDGVTTADQERAMNLGWTHSILQAVWDVLRDFGLSWAAAGLLLQDSSQSVYGIKGLNRILASADGENQMRTRMRMNEMARSVVNAIILDAEGETWDRKTTTFTGIPDMMDRFASRLAAATRIPVTVLMGQAPAGLNATGQADLQTWYDSVTSWQQFTATPAIRRIVEILLAEEGAVAPENWAITWPDVDPQADVRRAAVRLQVAQADAIYAGPSGIGAVTPEEIALSRFTAEGWSMETDVDLELRRKLDEVKDEKLLTEAENDLDAAKNPPDPATPPPPAPGAGGATSAGAAGSAEDGKQQPPEPLPPPAKE